jgi:putative ABC transport system ATP-binding protein
MKRVTFAKPAVVCRGLTKTYGSGNTQTKALQGVDLEVRAGELLMLVGPSGCGKTTLISIVAGVLEGDSGECSVLEHDLMRLTQAQKTAFRAQFIGFVFQSYNLVPALTAAENVALPLLIHGTNPRSALTSAHEMLEQVGLGGRGDTLPLDLSGGQQQRVAVARALIHKPALVVCDEPTSALDHRTGLALMELLSQVVLAGNRSLLVVTHDARIFSFAHRVAEMDDGRIVGVKESLAASAEARKEAAL